MVAVKNLGEAADLRLNVTALMRKNKQQISRRLTQERNADEDSSSRQTEEERL